MPTKNNLAKSQSDPSAGVFDYVKILALYESQEFRKALIGARPESTVEQLFLGLSSEKSTAKIHDDLIILRIPLARGYSALWLLDKKIGASQLPEFLPQLQIISSLAYNDQLDKEEPSTLNLSGQRVFDQSLLSAASAANQVSRTNRLGYILNVFIESFDAPHMALIAFVDNRIRRFAVSDESIRGKFSNAIPALTSILRTRNRSQVTVIKKSDQGADHLEALAALLNIQDAAILFPAADSGVALICDTKFVDNGQAYEMLSVANMVASPKPNVWDRMISKRRIWSKLLAIAIVVVLIWPGKLTVQGVILTTPAKSEVVSLAQQAQLQSINFDSGEWVDEGDVLANFISEALEDQLVQLQLESSLEGLNAQELLGQNEYGQVVLAEQRQKIVTEQMRAIENQIAELNLKAKISGRLIYILDSGTTGQILPVGTKVGEILPEDRFHVTMTLSDKDSYLIQEGQIGKAYFRGITDQTFDFELISPVLARPVGENKDVRLEIIGNITDPDQEQLIVGLSGYGKIEIGRRPNILIWLRLPIEYIRITLWKYLNSPF